MKRHINKEGDESDCSYLAREEYSPAFQYGKKTVAYDDYSEKNTPDDLNWRVEERILFEVLAKVFSRRESSNVLYFACDTGRILRVLKAKCGEVIGADISPQILKIVHKNVPEIKTVCTDITRESDKIPGCRQLFTTFGFVPFADPELRHVFLPGLNTKFKKENSVMIVGIHRNSNSRSVLSSIHDKMLQRPLQKPLSLDDTAALGKFCGQRVIGAKGCSFMPVFVLKILLAGLVNFKEQSPRDRPGLSNYSANLIVSNKKAA